MTGVTSDHREVRPGFVFVAVKGTAVDGHRFLLVAQEAGAVSLVGEEPAPGGLTIPYRQVPDSREALAELAAQFYGYPTRDLWVLGVTGTSGKTTTTYIVESILRAAGRKVGVIGTIAFRFGDKIYPSTHTTPGPVELQRLFSEMKRDGCDAVVMEVSSHALKQKRVGGVAFDAVAFSNLTPEHLDYHSTMEDYFLTKYLLLTYCVAESRRQGKQVRICVNADDAFGVKAIESLRRGGEQVISYGFGENVEVSGRGWVADKRGVRGYYEAHQLDSSLAGRFNASNILCALALTKSMGISSDEAVRGIRALRSVPGRMQKIENPYQLNIWIDYAHKPDALEKVLSNLQAERASARLYVVFGCGGDRDRAKRPAMAEIAQRLSDGVIVTSDNPRSEDPSAIIEEIRKGFRTEEGVWIEADRKAAIQLAISKMAPGDLLVVAGKGHETYQLVGQERIPFDDAEVASQALTRIFKNL